MRYTLLLAAVLLAVSSAVQAQLIPLTDAQKVAAPAAVVDMTGEEAIPFQPLTGQHVGDIDHLQSRDLVIQRQIIGIGHKRGNLAVVEGAGKCQRRGLLHVVA